jgi:acetoacetyl-CoA synthetase
MRNPLWIPSEERKQSANITRFIQAINQQYQLKLTSYTDLYQWSVDNIADFWAAMWDFAEIKASQRYDQVVDDLTKFPGAKFPWGAFEFRRESSSFPRRSGRVHFQRGNTNIEKNDLCRVV